MGSEKDFDQAVIDEWEYLSGCDDPLMALEHLTAFASEQSRSLREENERLRNRLGKVERVIAEDGDGTQHDLQITRVYPRDAALHVEVVLPKSRLCKDSSE